MPPRAPPRAHNASRVQNQPQPSGAEGSFKKWCRLAALKTVPLFFYRNWTWEHSTCMQTPAPRKSHTRPRLPSLRWFLSPSLSPPLSPSRPPPPPSLSCTAVEAASPLPSPPALPAFPPVPPRSPPRPLPTKTAQVLDVSMAYESGSAVNTPDRKNFKFSWTVPLTTSPV